MIDTSPAALRKLAKNMQNYSEGHYPVVELLRAIAAEKEAQDKQEPFAWASYGLMPNGVTGWRFATHKSTFWDDKSQQPLYLAKQHHPEQHLEMVAPADAELERLTGEPHIDGWPLYSGLPSPADVPLPEPVGFRTRYRSEPGMIGHYPWTYADQRRRKYDRPECEYEDLFTADQMHQYAEAYAAAKVTAERERCIGEVSALFEEIKREAGRHPDSYQRGKLVALDIAEQRLEALRAEQKGTV